LLTIDSIMVNENVCEHGATGVRPELLRLLRQEEGSVSGEQLSARLGVSRVAVWKQVKALRLAGYEIAATAKGYRLVAGPDAPYAWEMGARAERLCWLLETSSTMETALESARNGCPAFTVVVADSQTRGRGRLERPWRSEQGGLYFTQVLRPKLPPAQCGPVVLAAGLDMARAVERLLGVKAGLKWPNDLLVGEKKLAGVLAQMEGESDRVSFLNIGVGVNVNNDPSQLAPGGVSLAGLAGHAVSRRDLLVLFLDLFEARMADFSSDVSSETAIREWKKRSATLGRRVVVRTVRDTVEGVARDVDPDGGLVIETADGSRRTVVHGDCFHQPSNQ
jgi:BirA family transcriptional regulator, biotin operon repressor / biotin---[acetyl-CoA-carboxylase] ligase